MPFLFDQWYLILVVPAILFALHAQGLVKSRFKKYSSIRAYRGMTGAQVAEQILYHNGVSNVSVSRISSRLTDHYNSRKKEIKLSEAVYDSQSIAAIGVAAHEAGHALQHAEQYSPIMVRQSIIPLTQISSQLSIPLIIASFFFPGDVSINLYSLGICLFGVAVLFQLITLPVEFNASKRAINTLEGLGILSSSEIPKVKKVLSAAALTYVAALAVSIAQLVRLFLLRRK